MAETPSPPTPPPPWAELPPELTAVILQKLGAVETLMSAQMVCKAWRSVSLHPATWSIIDMRYDTVICPLNLEKLWCTAVERSQGYLVSVILEFICPYNLLNYMADRAPLLRSLHLISCYGVSGDELSLVIKRFPRLDDLQLYGMDLSGEVIEAIGESCPMLQSFRLNSPGPLRPQIDCDEGAFAIAKSMPTLRHLQLLGNMMTNDGLQAILDHCLHLESLDLRRCYNIRLSGSVAKKCQERICLLKCPDHFLDDNYGFDARIEDFESSCEDEDPLGVSDIENMSADDDGYYEFSDTEYYDSVELIID